MAENPKSSVVSAAQPTPIKITTVTTIPAKTAGASTYSLPSSSSSLQSKVQNTSPFFPLQLIHWLKQNYPSNCTPLLCPIQVVTPIVSCVELLLRQVFRSRVICVNDLGIYVLDRLEVPNELQGETNISLSLEASIIQNSFSSENCICADSEEFLIDFDRRLLSILPKPREFDAFLHDHDTQLQLARLEATFQHYESKAQYGPPKKRSTGSQSKPYAVSPQISQSHTPTQQTSQFLTPQQFQQSQSISHNSTTINPNHNPNNSTNFPNFPNLNYSGTYNPSPTPSPQLFPTRLVPHHHMHPPQHQQHSSPHHQATPFPTSPFDPQPQLSSQQHPTPSPSPLESYSHFNPNHFPHQHQYPQNPNQILKPSQHSQFYTAFPEFSSFEPQRASNASSIPDFLHISSINPNITYQPDSTSSNANFQRAKSPRAAINIDDDEDSQLPAYRAQISPIHAQPLPRTESKLFPRIETQDHAPCDRSPSDSFVFLQLDDYDVPSQLRLRDGGLDSDRSPQSQSAGNDEYATDSPSRPLPSKLPRLTTSNMKVDQPRYQPHSRWNHNAPPILSPIYDYEEDDSLSRSHIHRESLINDTELRTHESDQLRDSFSRTNANTISTHSSSQPYRPFNIRAVSPSITPTSSIQRAGRGESDPVFNPFERPRSIDKLIVNTNAATITTTTTTTTSPPALAINPIPNRMNAEELRNTPFPPLRSPKTTSNHDHTYNLNSTHLSLDNNYPHTTFSPLIPPGSSSHMFSPTVGTAFPNPLLLSGSSEIVAPNLYSSGDSATLGPIYTPTFPSGTNPSPRPNLFASGSTVYSTGESSSSYNTPAQYRQYHHHSHNPSRQPSTDHSQASSPHLHSHNPIIPPPIAVLSTEVLYRQLQQLRHSGNNPSSLYQQPDWEQWLIHTNITTAQTNTTTETGGDRFPALVSHLNPFSTGQASGHSCVVCKPLSFFSTETTNIAGKLKNVIVQHSSHRKQSDAMVKFQFYALSMKKTQKLSRVEKMFQMVQTSWKRSIDKLQLQTAAKKLQRAAGSVNWVRKGSANSDQSTQSKSSRGAKSHKSRIKHTSGGEGFGVRFTDGDGKVGKNAVKSLPVVFFDPEQSRNMSSLNNKAMCDIPEESRIESTTMNSQHFDNPDGANRLYASFNNSIYNVPTSPSNRQTAQSMGLYSPHLPQSSPFISQLPRSRPFLSDLNEEGPGSGEMSYPQTPTTTTRATTHSDDNTPSSQQSIHFIENAPINNLLRPKSLDITQFPPSPPAHTPLTPGLQPLSQLRLNRPSHGPMFSLTTPSPTRDSSHAPMVHPLPPFTNPSFTQHTQSPLLSPTNPSNLTSRDSVALTQLNPHAIAKIQLNQNQSTPAGNSTAPNVTNQTAAATSTNTASNPTPTPKLNRPLTATTNSLPEAFAEVEKKQSRDKEKEEEEVEDGEHDTEPYAIIIHTKTQSFEFRIPCLRSTLLLLRSLFQLQHYRLLNQTVFEADQLFHSNPVTYDATRAHFDSLNNLLTHLSLQKHWAVANTISNQSETAINQSQVKHQLSALQSTHQHHMGKHSGNGSGIENSMGLSDPSTLSTLLSLQSHHRARSGYKPNTNQPMQDSNGNSIKYFGDSKDSSDGRSNDLHDTTDKISATTGVKGKIYSFFNKDLRSKFRVNKMDKFARFCTQANMISQRLKIQQEHDSYVQVQHSGIITTALSYRLMQIRMWQGKQLMEQRKLQNKLQKQQKKLQEAFNTMQEHQLAQKKSKTKSRTGWDNKVKDGGLDTGSEGYLFDPSASFNMPLTLPALPKPPLLIIQKPLPKRNADDKNSKKSTPQDKQSSTSSQPNTRRNSLQTPKDSSALPSDQDPQLEQGNFLTNHKTPSKHHRNAHQTPSKFPSALNKSYDASFNTDAHRRPSGHSQCSDDNAKTMYYLDTDYIMDNSSNSHSTINQELDSANDPLGSIIKQIGGEADKPLPVHLQVLQFQAKQKKYMKLLKNYNRQQQLLALSQLSPEQRQVFQQQLSELERQRYLQKVKAVNPGQQDLIKSNQLFNTQSIDPIANPLTVLLQKTLGLYTPSTNFSPNLRYILEDEKFRSYIICLMFQQYQHQNINQLLYQFTGAFNIFRHTVIPAVSPPPQYILKVELENTLVSSSPAVVEAAVREHFLSIYAPHLAPSGTARSSLTSTFPLPTLDHLPLLLTKQNIGPQFARMSSGSRPPPESEYVLVPSSSQVSDSTPTHSKTILDRLQSRQPSQTTSNSNPSITATLQNLISEIPAPKVTSAISKHITKPKRYLIKYASKNFSSKGTLKDLLHRKKRTTTFLYCPICKSLISKTSAVICVYCNQCVCRNATCCTTTAASLTTSISMFPQSSHIHSLNSKDGSVQYDALYNATDQDGVINKKTHICSSCVGELKSQYYKVGRGGNTAVIEFIGLEGLPPIVHGKPLSCDFFMEGSRQIVRTQCHDTNALFGSRLIFSFLHTGQLAFTLRVENKVIGHSFISLSSLLNCDELKTIVFPIYAPKGIEKPTPERDLVAQNHLYTVPAPGSRDVATIHSQRAAGHIQNAGGSVESEDKGTLPIDQMLLDEMAAGLTNAQSDGVDPNDVGITGSLGDIHDESGAGRGGSAAALTDPRIFNAIGGQTSLRPHIIARGVMRVSVTISWHELLFASMYEGWAPTPPQSFETSTLIYDVKRLVEVVSSFQFSSFGQFFSSLLHYRSPSHTIIFTILSIICVLWLPAQAFVPFLLMLLIFKLISTYLFQVSVQHAKDNAMSSQAFNQEKDFQILQGNSANLLDLDKSMFSPDDPLKLNILRNNKVDDDSRDENGDLKNAGLTSITQQAIDTFISPVLNEELDQPEDRFYANSFAAPLRRGVPITSISGTVFDIHGFMQENGWDPAEDDIEPTTEYDTDQVKRLNNVGSLNLLIGQDGDFVKPNDLAQHAHLVSDLIDLDPPVVSSIASNAGTKPEYDSNPGFASETHTRQSNIASTTTDSGPSPEDDSGLFNVYKRVNETLTTIQGVIRMLADVFEKIQNIANWTNPLVSTIIIILLVVIAVLFYIIPMRVLLCIIIIHQMSKKVRFLIKKTHVPDEITNIFQQIQTNRELYPNANSIDGAKLSIGQQNYL